jgi:hypothetical protein
VACSTNGNRVLAATCDGGVCFSSDSGGTWALTSAPSNFWVAVAISADGMRLAAAPRNGPIYISTNAGSAWNSIGLRNAPDWTGWSTNLSTLYWWNALAMSADGSKLAIGGRDDIFISADGGATWRQAAGQGIEQSIALSADGTKVAAAASYMGARDWDDNGGIFVAQSFPFAPAPRLDVVPSWTVAQTNGVASSNACVTLTWRLAQTGYALQANSDLDPAGWVDVNWGTQGLVLLDMNHDADNQAVFFNSGPERFFRLKKQ